MKVLLNARLAGPEKTYNGYLMKKIFENFNDWRKAEIAWYPDQVLDHALGLGWNARQAEIDKLEFTVSGLRNYVDELKAEIAAKDKEIDGLRNDLALYIEDSINEILDE